MIKAILRWFLQVPLRIILPLLPSGFIYALGKAGGHVHYRIARDFAEKVAAGFKNLAGEEEAYDFRRVALRCCQNHVMSELEVLLYGRMNSGNIERYVSLEGRSILDGALAAGRGVILLHAHFGNEHLLMPALGHRGYTVNQVGLHPDDAVNHLQDVMLRQPDDLTRSWFKLKEECEKKLPVTFIYLGKSLRPAVECLKRNEILAISLDGVDGNMITVPFLRKKAQFLPGPIRLAMATGAMIVPAFTVRKRNGTPRLVIEDPIEGYSSIEEAVMRFKSLLEEYMKRYPCHYAKLLAFDAPPFGTLQ